MGFRFRRTLRLIPGLRLNLSKSGVSASVGTRGAWLTFGRRGPRATVGIPGTGISYTEILTKRHAEQPYAVHSAAPPASRSTSAWTILLVLLVIAAVVAWIIGVAIR